MRYSTIAGLLLVLSSSVAAAPSVFELTPRCVKTGQYCDPDKNGQCCDACCAYCASGVKRDDEEVKRDGVLVKRSDGGVELKREEDGYVFCNYYCCNK
ncbi:hypothetical protein N7520_010090 [Penicillium odoratum]|uniref:uncharacterized protein n=1 Tax=Penicillium odoratum TaxID=1167516 RepID=UPI002549ADF8|nr:uncharacterized protein N7520_010090 [Penicillium odoratum]KAJ5753173.1 hypothetical protein N7520_010090 [Penicillium odoratum]